MLQILVTFVHELVQQSWIVASIFVKYFLFFVALEMFLDNVVDLDNYLEKVLDYSPLFVLGVVFTGLVNMFLGIFSEPVFQLFGEVVAFIYFLYLFWEY